MKPLFILVLSLLVSTICPAQSTEFNFTEVVEVPNTNKAELYARAMAWINESFVSSKAVIQTHDKEEGTIYGSAIITEDWRDFRSEIRYYFRIDVKDNKYRYTFRDYVYQDWYPEASRGPMPLTMAVPNTKRMTKKYWQKIKSRTNLQASLLILSLQSGMTKKEAGSGW